MNEPVSIDGADHVHALLSDYLNGELPDPQRQTIQAHLETCVACRRDYDSLRLTVQLVHQVPLRPVPRSFAIPAPPPRRRWSLVWLRVSTSALAALFVAVVALQLVLPANVHPTASTERAADAAPRAQTAYSVASSAAPTAAPRQAVPARAAAQATGISAEAASGPASTASSRAPAAAAPQSAPAAGEASPPGAAASSSTATGGEPAAANRAVKSEPTATAVAAPAPLSQPVDGAPRAPASVTPGLPTWYLPLLVTVGALFVISLAGLIWVSVRR